jgi:hypothetical protein
MACDKEQIGQDYILSYYIDAGDCGDVMPDPQVVTYVTLGGFTDKSTSSSRNPIETADDSSIHRRNTGGTITSSISGTINTYGSDDGGAISAAQKAFWEHYEAGTNGAKLWIQIENEFVTRTMFCLIASVENSMGTDANATAAVELPNAGPLGMDTAFA